MEELIICLKNLGINTPLELILAGANFLFNAFVLYVLVAFILCIGK